MIPLGECMYAGRKRRKPIQKHKSTPTSVKSNPSKRHRDRLNAELDHLASLLPFPPDIISKLDKLSVLRLSVSYLRVKSFFQALEDTELKKESHHLLTHNTRDNQTTALIRNLSPEGELLLDALDGFVLVASADGMVFYVSPTVIDYLGFHQTDMMHQSMYDFIHVDDRQEFQRQLHWAMNPPQQISGHDPSGQGTNSEENLSSFKVYDPKLLPPEFSPFLNRYFVIRVRCLLDSTSGFLTMQFQGRLKYLQGQRKKDKSGAALPPQLGLFCIAMPLLLPSIGEMKLKSLLLKTKHRLDLSPMTLGAKGKAIAGWSDAEHRTRSGCHYFHFTDVLCRAENQIRMMNTGENGLTVFRVLTKEGHWVWFQANGHLPYRNKSAEYATVPQEEFKDTDRSKEEHLRNQSSIDQSGSTNGFLYSNCNDIPLQLKPLYDQAPVKEGREEKYEPIRSDGGVSQNEPLNFCTSFPRSAKGSVADDLWVSEYSRGLSNLQPLKLMGRTNNDPGRLAKSFCGRSRLLSEPQLRDKTQTSSFQNIVQNFRAVGEKVQQRQLFDLHSANMESYRAESCKSEDVTPMCSPISQKSRDFPMEYCNSADLFHGVQVKSEYNVELHNGLGGAIDSPSHLWVDNEMGKKMVANLPGQQQLKSDSNTLEQLSPCEKLKTLLPSPLCGASTAKGSCVWMVGSACNHSRPSKQGMDMVHFNPQRATHPCCSHSDQPTDCLQAHNYPRHTIQDKGPGQDEYKVPLQFKSHDLIHTVIKQEPSPSPPWSCDNLHNIQAGLQKNMPSCLINSLSHKITQNAYL
ncbi:aryl hydrocarbon receptor-like isoform X1 [Hypanus sabinus]|uniref:aryl hydrocarbon receptor-like isoform X1 n=2 Tax=Hypanus sabinus TaxID=79690 RepID=UPI0028C4993D|nr:aryl hydrocarbon receptor-like isoform X1 [Hypanus sabinus]